MQIKIHFFPNVFPHSITVIIQGRTVLETSGINKYMLGGVSSYMC